MKTRIVVLTILALVILPTVIGVVGWQKGLFAQERSSFAHTAEELALSATPISMGEKVSLVEAQARLPWTIPSPSYTITETTLEEAWVSTEQWPPQERQLFLVYSNGLMLSIWPEPNIPSDWLALEELPFKKVIIRGQRGHGKEPGVQQIEGHGEHKYGGSVAWWENRLSIHIHGEFPMAELQKVAESMPAPTWTKEAVPGAA